MTTSTLANGATLITRKAMRNGRGYIVLALFNNLEYVTWWQRDPTLESTTYSGDYYMGITPESLEAATKSLNYRAS